MRTLVLCDDTAHPASLTRDGLLGLGDCGCRFDWLEDPGQWSPARLEGYPLVILSKANNRSRTESAPWATEADGLAFAAHVTGGSSLLVLHSGTALYDNSPSLCRLLGGIFTGHPAQCPVTVEPRAAHPLTRGSGAFTLKDEHYQMAMNDPGVRPVPAHHLRARHRAGGLDARPRRRTGVCAHAGPQPGSVAASLLSELAAELPGVVPGRRIAQGAST